MNFNPSASRRPTIRQSLGEYGRGLAGGLLFALPLIYTMEMWWTGFLISPERMLAGLFVTLLLLVGYNRFAGMRRDATWTEVVIDSVEEMGLGLLVAALALWLLGRIGPGMSFEEIGGKVLVESLVVAIGVSVGTAQLGGGERGGKDQGKTPEGGGPAEGESKLRNLISEAVLAFCGGVLIAANVAPTDEIVILAAESGPGRLTVIVLFSLFLAMLVLYFSGFRGADQIADKSYFHVALGIAMTYSAALAASAALLWFFGRFDGGDLLFCLRQTVVLSVPGTLGASAGRLLLQA